MSNTTGNLKALALVNNQQFADLVFLVGAEQTPVYGHRAHLFKSEYFARMFGSGMRESKLNGDGRVEVLLPEVVNADVLICLLDYIYAGSTAHIKADNIVAVAQLADQYLEKELFDSCFEHVLLNRDAVVTTGNCLPLQWLAEGFPENSKAVQVVAQVLDFQRTRADAIVEMLANNVELAEAFAATASPAHVENISMRLKRIGNNTLVDKWITEIVPATLLHKKAQINPDGYVDLGLLLQELCEPHWTTVTSFQLDLSWRDVEEAIAEFESKEYRATDLCTKTAGFTFALQPYDTKSVCLLQCHDTENDKDLRPRLVSTYSPDGTRTKCRLHRRRLDHIQQVGTIDTFRQQLQHRSALVATAATLSTKVGRCYTAELCLDVAARCFGKLPNRVVAHFDGTDLLALVAHEELTVEDETTLLDCLVRRAHFKIAPVDASDIVARLHLHHIRSSVLLDALATNQLGIPASTCISILAKALNPPPDAQTNVRAGWTAVPIYYGPEVFLEQLLTPHKNMRDETKKRPRDEAASADGNPNSPKRLKTAE